MRRSLSTVGRLALAFVLVALLALGARYAHQRWWTANFHTVLEGTLYRSGQPSGAQLEEWSREHGIRTLLDLRDDDGHRARLREQEEATAAGMAFVHLPLSDRHLPGRWALLSLLDLLEEVQTPLLVHCRAGADRTGVVCALAAMALGGWSYEQARGQLSARYLHVQSDPEAVEGLLRKYEEWCWWEQRDTGGWEEFSRWAREHYSESYYLVHIEAPERLETAPGEALTVPLVVHNRTDQAIPCEDPTRRFSLSAYLGTAREMVPDRELGPRLRLQEEIAPFGSLELKHEIFTPEQPGRYEIHWDLIEETVTWFVAAGSPEISTELVVRAP